MQKTKSKRLVPSQAGDADEGHVQVLVLHQSEVAVDCVSYWLAQLSSHLRLDLQGAFTINKPPTLNQSRARLSNSLGGPMD